MKLTKLMVLALVLVLFVCAFVACGGTTDTETQAPETQAPETQAPDSETEAPGEDTEAECAHEIVVDEKAATCSDRGYKKETCKLCGEVISETAYPKAAHTASGAATCDTDSKCTVCGEVLEAAKGHVWGEVTTTAATCTAAGKETKTCTVCNTTDVKELATLAHDIAEATEYVPATCTTEGSKTGVCSLCGQTQTVVLPAAHVVTDLGDLSALTFVDGKIQAKCTACEAVVDVTAEVRFALSFDEADVPTELAKYGDGFNYLLVYNGDQAGTVTDPNRHPAVTKYADATDGHTSVLTTKHNCSPAITFKGELLADADYYVISFDWRATKYGNNTNKIGAFGQAAKAFEGVAGEGDMVYAFKVDRSNGDLYDHSGKNKFGTAPAEQWYKVVIVVDNESGTAYTYMDGVCVATTQNAKWQVVEGGEYTWRFGGIYNVYHIPEFDNFEVVAIQKSVTEVGPSVDGGDEEEGDEEDDGTGCAHQCYLEYQLPTPTTPGFIKRTCLICGRIVTLEVLDHIHTPDRKADCVNSSYCTECGALIEAARGHVLDENQSVTDTLGTIPCVDKGRRDGFCVVCQQLVSVDLDPIAHTFKITALDQVRIVDGVVMAECVDCKQLAEVPEESRLVLNFDKSTLAEELGNYGLTTFETYTTPNAPLVVEDRTVLSIPHNSSTYVVFDADLLDDADYYVISFDWRGTKWSHTTNKMGVFALSRVEGTTPKATSDFLRVDRFNGTFYNGSSSAGKFDLVGIANQWYQITIVVDNASGAANVYIDGQLFASYGSGFDVSVEKQGARQYAWRFGGQYNFYHQPQFDNFKVVKLQAACEASDVVVSETECSIGYACKVHGANHVLVVEKENAVHTVPAPTTFDADTAMKDGKVQGVCTVCGLTADANIAEDVRISLDFDKATLDEELAAKNVEYNTALGTTDVEYLSIALPGENPYYTATVSDGASVLRTQNGLAVSSGRLYIQYSNNLLADASYYMISFDYRHMAGNQGGECNILSTYYGTGSMGKNFVKLNRTSGGAFVKFDADETKTYGTSTGVWYHFDIIVNSTTGQAFTFVNGEYLGSVSSNSLKPATGEFARWRFGESSVGHQPEYDNFTVSVLAKAPVLE